MLLPKVDLPEGQSGNWKVRHFTVSEEDAERDRVRSVIKNTRRWVPAGTYTGIYRGSALVMSDTPDEMRDHYEPVRHAKGHCLVLGLGIGMVVAAMLEKSDVEKVTVIEISEDVIALTGPTLKARYGDRLKIVQADALTWRPPLNDRYEVVWADIWDHITPQNLTEMTLLKRRYARKATWKGCWAEDECRWERERYTRSRW